MTYRELLMEAGWRIYNRLTSEDEDNALAGSALKALSICLPGGLEWLRDPRADGGQPLDERSCYWPIYRLLLWPDARAVLAATGKSQDYWRERFYACYPVPK